MNFQESLTCPICFGQYDAEEHIPRILPCGNGHSICSACILHLLFSSDANLQCPFDRSNMRLKERSLADFPQNLALKYFLVENNPITFCQVHGNKKLDIVCLQCRCRICYICEKRQHQGHKTELLEDVMLRVKEKATKFKECIHIIEDARTKRNALIEKKESKLRDAIDKTFEDYIKKLLEKRDIMKDTLSKQLAKLKEEVCLQENKEAGEIVQWAQTVKGDLNNQEFLVLEKWDEKHLYNLIDKESSFNQHEVEKWLQYKREQSELLLCTLDDLDEKCREMLQTCHKTLFSEDFCN